MPGARNPGPPPETACTRPDHKLAALWAPCGLQFHSRKDPSSRYSYARSADGETEAQGGETTCPHPEDLTRAKCGGQDLNPGLPAPAPVPSKHFCLLSLSHRGLLGISCVHGHPRDQDGRCDPSPGTACNLTG